MNPAPDRISLLDDKQRDELAKREGWEEPIKTVLLPAILKALAQLKVGDVQLASDPLRPKSIWIDSPRLTPRTVKIEVAQPEGYRSDYLSAPTILAALVVGIEELSRQAAKHGFSPTAEEVFDKPPPNEA